MESEVRQHLDACLVSYTPKTAAQVVQTVQENIEMAKSMSNRLEAGGGRRSIGSQRATRSPRGGARFVAIVHFGCVLGCVLSCGVKGMGNGQIVKKGVSCLLQCSVVHRGSSEKRETCPNLALTMREQQPRKGSTEHTQPAAAVTANQRRWFIFNLALGPCPTSQWPPHRAHP